MKILRIHFKHELILNIMTSCKNVKFKCKTGSYSKHTFFIQNITVKLINTNNYVQLYKLKGVTSKIKLVPPLEVGTIKNNKF